MFDLANHRLSECLWDGSRTLIYRAVRDADGGSVIIKVARSEYPTARELATLQHEYRLLQELDHPGVIKALATASLHRGLALLLEDFVGQPLHELIAAGRLDLPTTLQIGLSLAGTLSYLHRQGVLHKDIKPHNILCCLSSRQYKLIDFGIATRIARETQPAVRPDALEGTLAYMAPEQTGRMNRDIDHRTDLYALGVTLYEMLTGERPFSSSDPLELVHCHVARTPRSPHERNPTVPQVVSDVVMRLLAKDAADRYQSARGLASDLAACLEPIAAGSEVASFPLGRNDRSEVLHLGQQLYGREAEVTQLLAAFARVGRGRSELLLVAGAGGVGKSVLVNEIHRAIAQSGGEFIAGKFDQLHREKAFAPFVQAFRDLSRRLLAAPSAELAQWRVRLLAALGNNGRILTDMLPELELVLGPQPAVAKVGPGEAQNRLWLTFQSFVHVFCKDSPLVVFLDDLQWADPASLWLLRQLLLDREGRHLLFIGAYRDSEVASAHPFRVMLNALLKEGVQPVELQVAPLSLSSVCTLLGDALPGSGPAKIDGLAARLMTTTQGNPLFLTQLLLTWYRTGLLRVDPAAGDWTWDEAEIATAPVADNMAAFLTQRLLALDPKTQTLLSLAACIGHRFNASMLAVIAACTPEQAAVGLWPMVREGLVVPLSGEYRLLMAAAGQGGNADSAGLDVAYRFLHDRVQQAAYALIEPAQRQAVHLQIGRCLRAVLSEQSGAEALFEVVHHLNAGADGLLDPQERRELARLNRTAGGRAKAATAYGAAADYLGTGIALVGTAGWALDHEMTFALHLQKAECDFSCGRTTAAEAGIAELLSRARTRMERGRTLRLRVVLCSLQGHYTQAIEAGREALGLYGIQLPSGPEECMAAFVSEVAAIDRLIENQSLESLFSVPLSTDPEIGLPMEIASDLFTPAYQIAPYIVGPLTAKSVAYSLSQGFSRQAAPIYSMFGTALGMLARYADGFRFQEATMALVEQHDITEARSKVFQYAGFESEFLKPLSTSLSYFLLAYETGLASGDFVWSLYGGALAALTQFRIGNTLQVVYDAAQRAIAFSQRIKEVLTESYLIPLRQTVAALQGRTRGRTTLSDGAFDEVGWRSYLSGPQFGVGRSLFSVFKLFLCLVMEDKVGGLAILELEKQADIAGSGLHEGTDLAFYGSLILTGAYANTPAVERPHLIESLARHRAILANLAENACPENELHRQALVDAEVARIEDRELAALSLYDQAIDLAAKNGFPNHEALANELCAKFHLSRGRKKVARAYLREARFGYARWGATAKVAQLGELYPEFFSQEVGSPTLLGGTITSAGDTTGALGNQQLDMTAVLRAAQAITSEIVLDKLLDRLMRIICTSAGAQKGVLVLVQAKRLTVEAIFSVNPDAVAVGMAMPLEGSAELACSVAQYVERTLEPLLLNTSQADSRFTADPYLQLHKPRSLLCVPLLHQGRLKGVLYLENYAAKEAFSPARIELVSMLSAQATIAVENALLYRDLESQVEKRTAELNKALADLWAEMDLARKIQNVLLPPPQVFCGRYEFAGVMRAADEVGGDYYDIFAAGGKLWLFIGDVSGHGVSAGLIMMMVQTAVRTLVQSFADAGLPLGPSHLLTLVNSAVWSNLQLIGKGQYMTMTALCIADQEVVYAGLHQSLLIFRSASKQVEELESQGVWLGITDEIQGMNEDCRVDFAPGDALLLYTDGLTEARRSENMSSLLNLAPIMTRYQESCRGQASSVAVTQDILALTQDCIIKDDISVVALRNLGIRGDAELGCA